MGQAHAHCRDFSICCLFCLDCLHGEATGLFSLPWGLGSDMPLSPWPGSSVGWSITGYAKVVGLIPWSGHMQEATSECINKGNNESIFLPLCPPSSHSLKSINKNTFKKRYPLSRRAFLKTLRKTAAPKCFLPF